MSKKLYGSGNKLIAVIGDTVKINKQKKKKTIKNKYD
jgi:hypothetical protein